MSIVTSNESRRELRARLLKIRSSISPENKKMMDLRLARKLDLYIHKNCQKGQTIALYYPTHAEPDLLGLAKTWIQAGFHVALPVVSESLPLLSFAQYVPGEPLIVGAYNICEPSKEALQMTQVDMLVIPCVGYNAQNYRLGYGGGYYDRTLARYPMPCVGVAYSVTACQFQIGEYDIPLDTILSI